MGNLHLEILDNNRRLIFQKLSFFAHLGYLAGGTALALQISHRISYDFDVFCPKEIEDNFPAKVKKEIGIKETLINSSDEFTFLTGDDIKISFIYYPFEFDSLIIGDINLPIKLLSPLGVAASKAYALNRRNAWRDYLDIYYVVKNGLAGPEEVIHTSQEVYKELFSEKLFLAQLVYTDDIPSIEVARTQLLASKVTLEEVKLYFQRLVDDYWRKTQL